MVDVSSSNRTFQPDSDVHITLDDQQKINYFARCHSKYDEAKAELKAKQSEFKNFEEATEELFLHDSDSKDGIPYLQGEVFLCLNTPQANKALEKEKKKLTDEIRELEETCEEFKSILSGLKSELYGKFGNHINLDD